MEQSVALYQRLKEQASVLDEPTFVRRYRGWYLFSQLPPSQMDRIPFVTQVHRVPTAEMPTVSEAPEPPAATERIWKVEKASENAWKRRVSVGRAANNDIVIRHDSVSKLHAHFHTVTGIIERGSLLPCMITDVGSSNGTTINGALLTMDKETPVANKDNLVFGTVSCRFLDASTLHAELNALDWF